jgi:hypothetical protein
VCVCVCVCNQPYGGGFDLASTRESGGSCIRLPSVVSVWPWREHLVVADGKTRPLTSNGRLLLSSRIVVGFA